jgi:hypothetical protein
LGLINFWYIDGTTNNDKAVDTIKPEMIDQANGGHKVDSVITRGNKPAIVVNVVKMIGRVLLATAS